MISLHYLQPGWIPVTTDETLSQFSVDSPLVARLEVVAVSDVHTSSIPVQDTYSQNFEFGGFIDQVERTYEALRGRDPRLDRRMPFSMFQHSMCTILNCCLLDLTLENGEIA